MGSRGSKDEGDGASDGYPQASILKGARESDCLLASQAVNAGESSNASIASLSPEHKLTIWTGMVFIVGEMAGSGVLALPRAIENAGWIGLVVLTFSCFAVGWCGILLGKCWLMLEERFPEYQDHCRDPYPSIGFEAFGRAGKLAVSICIDITLFGVSVVFMILASTNLNAVFTDVPALHFSPCFWMIIVAVVLTPFVWLGTPKDFWPIAVGATVATGIACVFLLAAIATFPSAQVPSKVEHNEVGITEFALAFGTILFSFGGAPAFPTIQHDMAVTSHFPKALMLGFLGLILMYLPVAAAGYALLGSRLNDNVLITLSDNPTWMYYTIQALICAHLLFAFTIIINPLCQELEKVLKVPLRFTWKRALLRTICVMLVLFVAETVPHFGPILSLLGGSTNTLLSIVFPCIFYIKLTSQQSLGWPDRRASLHEKVFSVQIVVVGIIGGAVATYSAIKALADPKTLVPPCYVNMTDI